MDIRQLSENHRLRKRYLDNDQVPTPSLMKKIMSPALANVYFMCMDPKIKIIAGLEPPLKGGGDAWFVPPESLLQGNVVMKPLKKRFMKRLSYTEIDKIGQSLYETYRKRQRTEVEQALQNHNAYWVGKVNLRFRQYWSAFSEQAGKENTMQIQNAFQQFAVLYATTLDKIQDLVFREARNNAAKIREETYKIMQVYYEYLLKQQTTMLYKRYEKQLMTEKITLKKLFTERLFESHKTLTDKLHDINLEKHTAIEKMRQYLEMKNVACQVYVALKERGHAKEVELTSELNHQKAMAIITKTIRTKDYEIKAAEHKEWERKEVSTSWQKKVADIVKHLQTFVSYSLRSLPEQADFFMNIEKLILMQLDKVLEDPKSDSIIVMEEEKPDTPIPKPHPFYLFCDKGYKPKIHQNLCPKHCTSSASQLPVLVIDKRCIYSACDNFGQLTDHIEGFVNGKCEECIDLKDYHDYSRDVPVKYTSSQQLHELKLESSLLQVLQKEIVNARGVPIECNTCKIPHCFDCNSSSSTLSPLSIDSEMESHCARSSTTLPSIKSGKKNANCEDELRSKRESKLESYSKYVETKKCDCSKIAKKTLLENLPSYMRKMSAYDTPGLLNYEKCSVSALKSLVKKARAQETVPPPPKVSPKTTKEIGTQYSDQEFDYICTCLSNEAVTYLCNNLKIWEERPDSLSIDNQFGTVGGSLSPTCLLNEDKVSAAGRARSLKRLIDQSPGIEDIFEKTRKSD